MGLIIVLQGTSTRAQEETVTCAVNQMYCIAELIRVWAEAILDYRLFYWETWSKCERLEPFLADTWGQLERAVLSHYCGLGPAFAPKACVEDLDSQQVVAGRRYSLWGMVLMEGGWVSEDLPLNSPGPSVSPSVSQQPPLPHVPVIIHCGPEQQGPRPEDWNVWNRKSREAFLFIKLIISSILSQWWSWPVQSCLLPALHFSSIPITLDHLLAAVLEAYSHEDIKTTSLL